MKEQRAFTQRDSFTTKSTNYNTPYTQRPMNSYKTRLDPASNQYLDFQGEETSNLVPLDQRDPSRGPREDLYDRFYRRNTSNKTLVGREYIQAKHRASELDPKIVVTPVHEEFEAVHMDQFTRQISITRVSPYSPKEASLREHFSDFFARKFRKTYTVSGKAGTFKVLEDPLKRKSFFTSRVRSARGASGRLLGIMARQAINGRNPDISKIFQKALLKTNADALRKARKEIYFSRKKRLIKFFRRVKANMLRVLGVWMPDHIAVVLWKGLMLILIIAQICFSTYIVCFLPPWERNFKNPIFVMDFIGDLLFIVEILTQFQIAFYSQGELRIYRSQIIANYLGSTFLWDMISMLSLIGRYLSDSAWVNLLLVVNIRIYKLWPNMSTIEDFFQFSKEMSATLRVVKLIVVICLFAHYCACILYSLTKIEDADVSWIHKIGSDMDHAELYMVSLYSSVFLMSTGGFGDVIHQTQLERGVYVAVMIANSIIFGYILSVIGNLLIEVSAYSTEAKHKIRVLTKYMNEKGLNKNVQSKIRKYLEFFLDKENADKIEGDDILKMLSPNLQEEIVREVNAKILSDSYVFSANYRKRFLYLVSKDLIERSFGPEETLFYRNEDRDLSIYFVTSGKVDLCYERCGTSLQKIRKGEACGLYSFFAGTKRTVTAKSLEFTTVFQLPRERFLEKLELFATEKETYYMMKDSLNLYTNCQYLNIQCYSCGSIDHEISHCPNLHIIIDHTKVIKKYIAEEEQFRKSFERRKRTQVKTFKSLEQLNEAASQFQMGHQTEIHYSIDSMEDEEEEIGEVSSYSSLDEVLDRKIYDPYPLDYVEDSTNVKYLDMSRHYIHIPKKNRQKVSEVEYFMKNNYDPYYHNLNLDRVKNFEVYYPNNNISKMIVEFEKVRLEKLVERKLGLKAKHISTFLVKGLRANEKKNSKPDEPAKAQPILTIQRSMTLRKQMSLRRKEKKPSNSPRRDSNGSNPADIALYNSKSAKNIKPSQYKVHQPGTGTTGSTFLNPHSESRKGDSFENLLNRFGKNVELELSTIKERSYDKLEVRKPGRLSVDSPMSIMPSESKLPSMISRTPENNNSPSYNFPLGTKQMNSRDSDGLSESKREIEISHDAGTIDYSKRSNRGHHDRAGESYVNTKMTIKSEKEMSLIEDKSLLRYLKFADRNNKNFQQLLQERVKGQDRKHKLRAASEGRGKQKMSLYEDHDDEYQESCDVLDTNRKISTVEKKAFQF